MKKMSDELQPSEQLDYKQLIYHQIQNVLMIASRSYLYNERFYQSMSVMGEGKAESSQLFDYEGWVRDYTNAVKHLDDLCLPFYDDQYLAEREEILNSEPFNVIFEKIQELHEQKIALNKRLREPFWGDEDLKHEIYDRIAAVESEIKYLKRAGLKKKNDIEPYERLFRSIIALLDRRGVLVGYEFQTKA